VKIDGIDNNSVIRPVIVGGFGPPTLACIRSWGRQGFSVGMIWVQSRAEPQPSSKYLKDFVALPSDKLITPKGIQIINEFLIRFRATGMTCVAESIACWLNENRHMFPTELAVWLPTNKTIKDLISKQKQIEIARKIGFNVLPTYFISKNLETIDPIPKDHFPLCLRPDDPATVTPIFKVHLVHSQEELIKYVKSMQKIGGPIVAQPFMRLPNLVVHGARTINSDSVGLQGFLVERKFEGVTLTIHPANLEKDFLDKCVQFTDYFNVTGNYHFEFLVDKKNGSAYFLELNNRLGGTTAKVFACGYDEPLLVLESYGVLPTSPETREQKPATSNKQPASSKRQPTTIVHRPLTNVTVSSKQALLKYFYYTIKGRLTPLDYPPETNLVRLAKTIYGFIRYRDDVFMLRDVKGSMALYFGNLKSKV
jgi:predicted ATP-grasp superfamily ATP-dependent carboligase